jgi:ABC-type molybdate transport system substrate-binding protein
MITIPREYFEPETIAVAVLESTGHPEIAAQFCTFMASDEALEVFHKFGFLPVEE